MYLAMKELLIFIIYYIIYIILLDIEQCQPDIYIFYYMRLILHSLLYNKLYARTNVISS